ncbi:hypothetical protein CaCOL14_013427 [Colletotrichum acutatum]
MYGPLELNIAQGNAQWDGPRHVADADSKGDATEVQAFPLCTARAPIAHNTGLIHASSEAESRPEDSIIFDGCPSHSLSMTYYAYKNGIYGGQQDEKSSTGEISF